MLVDIVLQPEDVLLLRREAGGETTITIPSDILIRSYASYLANLMRPITAPTGETVQ